ncbi:hypothetical protein EYF80_015741 [Liparis tanakae]|uniref:Uncharacterized protein n=1 Tax=Liparis tanakae TaxID=230148 RepID=A0A4Z2I8A3_9TELE|nr:hypothetical protein EYF80_015741 [Liparis tanakae]
MKCPNPVSALQLEGVFSAAEVVDEVAELVDVLQALRHDHLLVEQVGLRQVGSSSGSLMDGSESLTRWKSWTMSAGSPSPNSGTGTLMSSTCSLSSTRILSSSCRRNWFGSSTSAYESIQPVH